jgi:hypothetical protein
MKPSPSSSKPMPRINKISIEKLMAKYSVLLLDAYGVLVHASGALPAFLKNLTAALTSTWCCPTPI